MKGLAPAIILLLAFSITVFSLIGDGSYFHLSALEESLARQEIENEELQQKVQELRREVTGLQTNDRMLEKAARNELGMVRENELIVIFEEE